MLAVLFAMTLVASACSGPPQASGPTEGGLIGDSDDVEMVDRSGPFTVTVFHELADDSVDIDLVAPVNAAQVQLAFEPTFANTEWIDVSNIELMTLSTGVQEFFARYRASDGSTVGGLQTRALSILPSLTPLTGSVADPELVRVTKVADAVLQIDLIIGEVVYEETGQAWLAGPDLPVEQWSADNMTASVDGQNLQIVEVGRQSWPVGNIDFDTFAMRHRIHVRMADGIDGASIAVDLDGFDEAITGDVSATSFTPAIRLGELGWAAAEEKRGYVTVWSELSEQISAIDGWTARVVDADSGEEALSVEGNSFEQTNSDGELWRGDLTGAPTTVFDFSDLTAPGRYRLCVDDLGCSSAFDISEIGPWQQMTVTVARALFHQRSGIEFSQPYTAFSRPRPYHPDDGLVVEQSNQTLVADANGRGDGPAFTELVAGRTGETVDGAWGGHFDAGDWDRRVQHLWFARRLVDLVDLYPESTATLELNIPESGNEVPDLLDEARWTIDLFARLQSADGSIRGGIEAEAYSGDGTTSWTEEFDVFAYSADAWSSAIYAGVTADMAFVLEPYDSNAAAEYLESAIRAMEWAEANQQTVPSDDPDIDVQRAIAAVSLYRATTDERWHELFLSLSPLVNGVDTAPCVLATSCESNWRYATLPTELGRSDVRANAVESIVGVADELLFVAETTAFGWAPEGPNIQLIWSNGPSIPHSVALMRAFMLTGDQQYRDLAVRNASFALGGNPAGMSYITGVGTENPRQPLLVDQRNSDLPIWPGIPIYGIFTSWQLPEWYQNFYLRDAGTVPDPSGWPTLHSFYDQGVFAGNSEFTVHQSHGETIWTFGALHGTTGFTSEDRLVTE